MRAKSRILNILYRLENYNKIDQGVEKKHEVKLTMLLVKLLNREKRTKI